MKKKLAVIGIDASLNHTGVVMIDQDKGNIIDLSYIAEKKSDLRPKFNCAYFSKPNGKTKSNNSENWSMLRYRLNKQWFSKTLKKLRCKGKITHAIIEGYAYNAASRPIFETGGWGELIRYILLVNHIPYRVVDPMSLRSFSGAYLEKGREDKKYVMYKTALQEQPIIKQFPVNINEMVGPGSDIADAYLAARMLLCELKLRKGLIMLSQIPEHERRVYIRVTKSNPVNILDQDFCSLKEGNRNVH
ncbi:MAG: hypothetical protein PHF86_13075 [Candidatus Nanoarchaeia archaeon]|nr:hypothetical protein [Candidatus Nanoarchaeia archaeon]